MDVKTLAIQNQWVEGRPLPLKIWPSTASNVVPPTSILREKWWYYFMSSYFLVDVPYKGVFKSQIGKTSVGLFASCANKHFSHCAPPTSKFEMPPHSTMKRNRIRPSWFSKHILLVGSRSIRDSPAKLPWDRCTCSRATLTARPAWNSWIEILQHVDISWYPPSLHHTLSRFCAPRP